MFTFVWDGEHDVSLIFENSSKVKIQLKKVDESNSPLPGAVFFVRPGNHVILIADVHAPDMEAGVGNGGTALRISFLDREGALTAPFRELFF